MKSQAILVLFLLLIHNVCNAQSLNLGIKHESFVLFTKLGSVKDNDVYLTSFYLQGGVKLGGRIQFEVNYGFVLSEGYRFNGLETCLIGKYFFRERKEYIVGGYILHKNGGDNGHFYRTEDKFLSLGSLGVGTYISKSLYIQASYQFPIGDDEFGYRINLNTLDPYNSTYDKNRLVGLLKLGLGLSFDL